MARGPGKGKTNNPAGRTKGAPNKVTTDIKECWRNLLEKNTPNMIKWLERVAKDDPAKAIDLCAKVSEFIIPKLSRIDGSMNHSGNFTIQEILKDLNGRSAGLPGDNAKLVGSKVATEQSLLHKE